MSYLFTTPKIGHALLKWAFSEAAGLFMRDNPPGQKYLARLEKSHGKGKTLSVLAPHLASAVYYIINPHQSPNGVRDGQISQRIGERSG